MAAASAFGVAALTIALLMFGLAFAVATAQDGLVGRLETSTGAIKRYGGYVLVVVGAWFLLVSAFGDLLGELLR